jgi:hypothetical protein
VLNNLLICFYNYDETKGKGETKKKNNKESDRQGNKIKKFLELFKINQKEE